MIQFCLKVKRGKQPKKEHVKWASLGKLDQIFRRSLETNFPFYTLNLSVLTELSRSAISLIESLYLTKVGGESATGHLKTLVLPLAI